MDIQCEKNKIPETEPESEIEVVIKDIYTSCDAENKNSVHASKLVDYIKPYLMEDLNALNVLKASLDPDNTDAEVSSEQFYSIMNEWTKQVGDSGDIDDDRFNRTPIQLDLLEDKDLPYIQSTPRASFGQKLLSYSSLMNLSNVSSYSLTGNNTVATDKVVLEEELKEYQHKVHKLSNEMALLKLQLLHTEDNNESLQGDINNLNKRLLAEQQLIEVLQREKKDIVNLKEELKNFKNQNEDISRKLQSAEMDNKKLKKLIDDLQQEKTTVEEKYEKICKQEQQTLKQMFEVKTEMDIKSQDITTLLKMNEEIKKRLDQQKDIIDCYITENEQLKNEKAALQKTVQTFTGSHKNGATNLALFNENIDRIPMNNSQPTFAVPRLSLSSRLKPPTTGISRLPRRVSLNSIRKSTDCDNFIATEANNKNENQESLSSEMGQDFYKNDDGTIEFEKDERIFELEIQLQNHENCMEKLTAYEKEIEQLKCDNLNTLQKMEIVENEKNKLYDEVNRIKIEKADIESKYDDVLLEQNEFDKKYEFFLKEQETFNNGFEILKAQKMNLENDLTRIIKEKEELAGNHDQLLMEKEEINKKFQHLEERYTKIFKELNDLKKVKENIENLLKYKDDTIKKNQTDYEKRLQGLEEKGKELNQNEDKISSLENEIANLNLKLKSKEEEILNLAKTTHKDIEFKRALQEKMQREIVDKSIRIEELNKKCEDLQNVFEKSKNECDELRNKCTLLSNLNMTVEDNANQIQSVLNEKVKLISELTKLNGDLERKTSEMDTEINDLRNEIQKEMDVKNDLWHTIRNLQSEVAQEKDNTVKYKNTADDVQQLNNVLEEEMEQLQSTTQKLIQEKESLNKQLVDEKNNCIRISEQNTLKIAENEKLNKSIEELVKEYNKSQIVHDQNVKLVNTLSQNLNARDFEIKYLNKDIENLKTEITELAQKNKNDLKKYEEDVSKLISENEKLNKDVLSLNKEIITKRKIIKDNNDALKAVNDNLVKSENKFSALLQERNDLVSKLSDLESCKEYYKNSIESLNKQLDQKSCEIQNLQQLKMVNEKTIQSLDEEKRMIQEQFKQNEEDLKKVIAILEEDMKHKVSVLEEEKSTLSKRLHDKEVASKIFENSVRSLKEKLDKKITESLNFEKLALVVEDLKKDIQAREEERIIMQQKIAEFESKEEQNNREKAGYEKVICDINNNLKMNQEEFEVLKNDQRRLVKAVVSYVHGANENLSIPLLVKKLNTHLEALNEENSSLKNEVERLKEEMQPKKMNTGFCTCGLYVQKYDSPLEIKKSSYEKQQLKVEKLLDKIDRIENAMKLERTKNTTLKADLDKAFENNNKVIEEKKQLENEVSKIKEELNQKIIEIEDLKNEQTTLKHEVIFEKERYKKIQLDFIDKCEIQFSLEQELDNKQTKIVEMDTDLQKIKVEKTFLEKKLQNEEAKINELIKKLGDMNDKSGIDQEKCVSQIFKETRDSKEFKDKSGNYPNKEKILTANSLVDNQIQTETKIEPISAKDFKNNKLEREQPNAVRGLRKRTNVSSANENVDNHGGEKELSDGGVVKKRIVSSKNDESGDLLGHDNDNYRIIAKTKQCLICLMIVFVLLIIFGVFVQIQCDSVASENQLCPLDWIVETKPTGVPPH